MHPTNTFSSTIYNALVKSRRSADRTKITSRLWRKVWNKLINNRNGTISTIIHGNKVLVNTGYSYPLNSRLYRNLNQPLVEIVHQTSKTLGRPIYFVDVGAAIGDTVLLVSSNCVGEVEHYYAIDGDKEFFEYLKQNLANRPDCSLFNVLLSSETASMQSLVRTHQGTASAQGAEEAQSTTLDNLLHEAIQASKVDVIKLDIDGFDGRALSGAGQALRSASAVIFEWHPILYRQTGNSWLEPFEILSQCSYTNFVWFTKFGNFSQITEVPSDNVLNRMAEYCLADVPDDWHWDVVALKADTKIAITELARMQFAAKRASRW